MSETYTNIEDWICRVLPEVISCPKEKALDALQSVASEFFKESRVWSYTDAETVPAKATEFEFTLPASAEIVEVASVRLNGTRCSTADYRLEYHTIYFHNMPNQESTIVYELILRPGRYCTEVPARLMEEYGDTIIYGALAKLKAMSSGQEGSIKWSDPETAKYYFELYQQGLNDAKTRAYMQRAYSMIKPVRW